MIPSAAIAVRDAIEEIRALTIAEMERRGKVATGRTMSTLSTSVTVSQAAVTGTLTGEEQWKWVGNGRRPGRMPPIAPIQEWINAKGLTISAYAVQRTIGKLGSKDWRNKATNVFQSAMDDFEQGKGIERLEEKAGQYFEEQATSLAIKYLK